MIRGADKLLSTTQPPEEVVEVEVRDLPDIPSVNSNSKDPNEVHNKKMKSKLKVEKKLRQVQNKGLSSETYKGRLSRKIVHGLKNLQPVAGQCPNEMTSRFKVKSGTFVTCKHVMKTPLVMLDKDNNFMFCSVEVT